MTDAKTNVAVPNHCKCSPAFLTAQIWWWEAGAAVPPISPLPATSTHHVGLVALAQGGASDETLFNINSDFTSQNQAGCRFAPQSLVAFSNYWIASCVILTAACTKQDRLWHEVIKTVQLHMKSMQALVPLPFLSLTLCSLLSFFLLQHVMALFPLRQKISDLGQASNGVGHCQA